MGASLTRRVAEDALDSGTAGPRCTKCRRRTGVEGVPLCPTHKCGWDGCNAPKKGNFMNDRYCAKHTCSEIACDQPVKTDGATGCAKHICSWPKCIGRPAPLTMMEPLCVKHKAKKEKMDREAKETKTPT